MNNLVFIYDSDPSVRDAMVMLVESVGYEVRVFSCLEEAANEFDSDRIGCMLVGARSEGAREFEILKDTILDDPAARVVLLNERSSTAFVVRAMRAGVSNILEHPFSFHDLLEAVRTAIAENLSRLQSESKRLPDEVSRLLTKQEEDIAMLLLDGAATKEMAAKLDLSVRTIHYRKKAIFKKIGASSRSQALKLLARKQASVEKPLHYQLMSAGGKS